MNVMLVEDDAAMRDTLVRTLTRRGLTVNAYGDGDTALTHWRAKAPDVVILDLTLPGTDGLTVLVSARRLGLTTPVIVTTARSAIGDRIVGLNAGADDYLAKPFDLDELEARVRALARRGGAQSTLGQSKVAAKPGLGDGFASGKPRMALGLLTYDEDQGAFYTGNAVLEVTPRESALLLCLLQRPGMAVSKDKLFTSVFPNESEVAFEAVEVVAYRLRKKLKTCGLALITLRGLGYLLKPDDIPAKP